MRAPYNVHSTTRPIVILGMHRSGTSLLAKMVHYWGAYIGLPAQLIRPTRWNVTGYWEYGPLVEFNKNLLAAVNSTWCLPPNDRALEVLRQLGEDGEARRRGVGLAQSMQEAAGNRPWIWKDPRFSITLSFWKNIWANRPLYIVAVRDPLEIAESLRRRNGFDLKTSLCLWQRYCYLLMTELHSEEDVLYVRYEWTVSAPREVAKALAAKLQIHCRLPDWFQGDLTKMATAVAPVRSVMLTGKDKTDLLDSGQRALRDLMFGRAGGMAVEWDGNGALECDWRTRLESALPRNIKGC